MSSGVGSGFVSSTSNCTVPERGASGMCGSDKIGLPYTCPAERMSTPTSNGRHADHPWFFAGHLVASVSIIDCLLVGGGFWGWARLDSDGSWVDALPHRWVTSMSMLGGMSNQFSLSWGFLPMGSLDAISPPSRHSPVVPLGFMPKSACCRGRILPGFWSSFTAGPTVSCLRPFRSILVAGRISSGDNPS